MENKFCFLKGLVDCDSGRIQDCNVKRVTECMLETSGGAGNAVAAGKPSAAGDAETTEHKEQAFCYLKGLVDCNNGRIQDCNIKRVTTCPLGK